MVESRQNGVVDIDPPMDGLFRSQPPLDEGGGCGSGGLVDLAQVTAMLSNFSTSYNVVNISMVLPILKAILLVPGENDDSSYSQQHPQHLPYHEDAVSAVASTLLAGMMIGQVFGGALGDALGNLWMALNLAMIVQIIASLGSAITLNVPTILVQEQQETEEYPYDDLFWKLSMWRFILGIGAGAVYPLAASLSAQVVEEVQQQQPHHGTTTTTTTEDGHHTKESMKSLQRVVWTFSTQGLGFVTVPLVTVLLLYTNTSSSNLQTVAKLLLGLGSVPGIGLLSWQFIMKHCGGGRCRCGYCRCWFPGRHIRRQPIPTIDDDEHVLQQDEEEECENQQPNEMVHPVVEEDMHDDASSDVVIHSRPVEDRRIHLDVPHASEPTRNHHHYAGKWWDAIWHEEHLMSKLLGTACTWFLFDVLFYGNTLFQPIVIEAVLGPSHHHHQNREDGESDDDAWTMLQSTARNSLLLTSIALPGYFVAGYLLGKTKKFCYCGIPQTPRFVMLQGFAAMATLYCIIGVGWKSLQKFPTILIILYSLTFFFANYGPNTTTFVMPSMVYSPQCRSTLNGICAAAGKLGALVGASFFAPAADSLGNASVMILCAFLSVVAYLMTAFFVPGSFPNDHEVAEEEEDFGHHHHPPIAPIPTTPPPSINGVAERTIV